MQKLFTKEVKIALTAICAVVLLFYGINFLKGISLFKKNCTYYVNFNDITGLEKSSAVFVNGYPVGVVRTIDYDYEHRDNIKVGIEVDEKMRFPEGSHAELQTGMLGGTIMKVILGNSSKLLSPGQSFSGAPYQGLMEKAGDLVPTIQQMLPKLDSILTAVNVLVNDPSIAQSLHNAGYITANLKTTTDQLNAILRTVPPMMSKLDKTSANAEVMTGKLAALDYAATLNSVNSTVAQVNSLTADLEKKINSKESTLGLLLNDDKLYNNLNGTMQSSNALMQDLKANPKRYVHFSIFGRKEKKKE